MKMLDTIIKISESISKIKFDEAFTNAAADQLGDKVDMFELNISCPNVKEPLP